MAAKKRSRRSRASRRSRSPRKLTQTQRAALKSIHASGSMYALTMADAFWKTVVQLIDARLATIDAARHVRLTRAGVELLRQAPRGS